jgi:hypothetical protein
MLLSRAAGGFRFAARSGFGATFIIDALIHLRLNV